MTMGGTASNLLGLLLARDRAGEDVRRDGLPPNRWRIAASRGLHDSVRRSAALLGLGTEAVIARAHRRRRARCRVDALRRGHRGRGRDRDRRDGGDDGPRRDRPARRARGPAQRARRVVPRRRGGRFRADAVGHAPPPAATASSAPNSITADLHKLWWQPFGASALLVPDVARAARRPPRERLPQPAGGRGRGPAEPRRALAGHVAALRRAEGARRAARRSVAAGSARWSTRCSRSPSTPARRSRRSPSSSWSPRRRP